MDSALRHQLLRAVVRDRAFLKQAWDAVRPEDFSQKQEAIVAKAALAFWQAYSEPVGVMLGSEVEHLAATAKIGAETKTKLKDLVQSLLKPTSELVSVQALVDRAKALKKATFYNSAVEEIIELQDKGELSSTTLAELIDRANRELSDKQVVVHDYLKELNQRIDRRETFDEHSFPYLMIDPLDERIKGVGRGMLAIFLAPPAGGKGLALVHISAAYALQGLKVLHITLEDPLRLVEDRLDASLTNIPLDRLKALPMRLRKRFKKLREKMHGRIRIIDGTEDSWTVSQIEKVWEQEKQKGFEAAAIVIDYDDEIACEVKFKGENARRFEFAEIYRRLRRLAAKNNVIVWTAAQTTRGAEGRKVITSKDTAEDFSKIRKVFLALTIGSDPDPEHEGVKFIYVAKHRMDRSRFGVHICTDFNSALFYDREATLKFRSNKNGNGNGNR